MAGNRIGEAFILTSYGESHGVALGATVDGCPAGLALTEEDIQSELDLRRPGTSDLVSKRKERDRVSILSGIFDDKTIGTPINMIVYNSDVDSRSYNSLLNRPRPGHADLTYELKYGHRDHRGGGRSSGRETVSRVMGGAIAKKLLRTTHSIEILGHALEIGGVRGREDPDFEYLKDCRDSEIRCADSEIGSDMRDAIKKAAEEGDSVGGIVQVITRNVPPGVGEPVFEKLDAAIARAIVSIGAIKGVEFGAGFDMSKMRGSEANDSIVQVGGSPRLITNKAGGVLGGISTGNNLVVNVAVKPTPSISMAQTTIDLLTEEQVEIKISGRHDPCIVPRVIPVAESMIALVLADLMIRGGFIDPVKLD